MSQNLALTGTSSTLPPSLPVPRRDDEAFRLTAWCLSGAERDPGGPLRLLNVPNREQRAVLSARHKALADHMGKRDHGAIADAVTALIGCYRNGLKPGEDIHPVAAKYVKELQGLPTWACVRACDAIRLHQYHDCITFMPSTMRVREIASSYCEAIIREATEIHDVLRADRLPPPVDEEARKRVGLGFQKLSEELHGKIAERPKSAFKTYTAAELRAMYPPREPAAEPAGEGFEGGPA